MPKLFEGVAAGEVIVPRERARLFSDVELDVNELKEKPGKRWDLVVTALITAIISAGITLLIKG